jgi:hypothetical protein
MSFISPPHSPDVVPCDLFPFPKLKVALRGRKFNDIAMIQTNAQDTFAKFQTVLFTEYFKQCVIIGFTV